MINGLQVSPAKQTASFQVLANVAYPSVAAKQQPWPISRGRTATAAAHNFGQHARRGHNARPGRSGAAAFCSAGAAIRGLKRRESTRVLMTRILVFL